MTNIGNDTDPNVMQMFRSKALEQLAARCAASQAQEKIQNQDLEAGQPMYFYCRSCGFLSDVKQEDWFLTPPRKICGECQGMLVRGWIKDDTFEVVE